MKQVPCPKCRKPMKFDSVQCRQCAGPGFTIHGKHKTPEYRTWGNMKARCYNPSNSFYRIYGGRGIKVCDRWLNSFPNFLEDMGKKPTPKYSLDRIDSNGNYEPGNVRWADTIIQASNTSRNVHITFMGRTQTYSAWARELGIQNETLRGRIVIRKWSIEKALTTPVHQGLKRGPKPKS